MSLANSIFRIEVTISFFFFYSLCSFSIVQILVDGIAPAQAFHRGRYFNRNLMRGSDTFGRILACFIVFLSFSSIIFCYSLSRLIKNMISSTTSLKYTLKTSSFFFDSNML